MAEPNGIIFDFPDEALIAKRLRLFLTGGFYYFDSTSMISISQREDLDIVWPKVQALMPNGEWKTLAYSGIPPGKGKTLVVDLSGKLPAGTRKLRIWSNLELYWDRIAIDTSELPQQHYRIIELPLKAAQLRFRGFSTLLKSEHSSSPERFDYDRVTFQSFWNPLQGRYTRYGDVAALVDNVDSRFAVMGSGDELMLVFSAAEPVTSGWQRDFLLHFDGYVKDGDKHTAHAGVLRSCNAACVLPIYMRDQFSYIVTQMINSLEWRRRLLSQV